MLVIFVRAFLTKITKTVAPINVGAAKEKGNIVLPLVLSQTDFKIFFEDLWGSVGV